MDSCSNFSQFLLDKAIFSQRQFEKVAPNFAENDQNQNVFKLADFFRSLTPSDAYDMALRLYILFTKEPKVNPEQKQAIENLVDFTDKKLKEDAFNEIYAAPPAEYNSAMLKTAAMRNQSEQSPGPNDWDTKSTINNNSTQNMDVFNYLHNEAQRKNYQRFQNEQKRIRLETDGCTFQPNPHRSPQRSKSPEEVFYRLQQDLRKEKEVINSAKKIQFELKDCTFKPNIENSRPQTMYTEEDAGYMNTSHDQTFDRLYREYQSKRHATMENEIRKQALETKGCTFQPQLLTNRTGRSRSREKNEPERYNQLYKLHSERQRSLMKKRIDKVDEEEKRYTFKPQMVSSPRKRDNSNSQSKNIHERTTEWNNEKKRKIEQRLLEKMHTEQSMNQELNLPAKNHNKTIDTNDSISAYDRLYLDSSHKKVRKDILEKKVLKELGASFTPKTNAKRESSAHKKEQQNAVNRSLMFLSPTSMGGKNDSVVYDPQQIHNLRKKSPHQYYRKQNYQNPVGGVGKNSISFRRSFYDEVQKNNSTMINDSKNVNYTVTS